MSKRKKNEIQVLFRNMRKMSLEKMVKLTKCCISTLSNSENYIVQPRVKNIYKMAKALNINHDILLYSYGILPQYEQQIIKSDPFYYMEKINKICNNHSKRYRNEEIDLSNLNQLRVYDYILKGEKDE